MNSFGNTKLASKHPIARKILSPLLISILLIAAGCAYQPVARYAKEQLPDPIYVDVHLVGVEPQNGVYIKEEVMRILRTHFHEQVVSKRDIAASELTITSYKISYSPLAYDTDGYVIRYHISVDINFHLKSSKGELDKRITGSEDVNIQPGSLTSAVARERAIKTAIRKAMDKFIAYIAKKGYGK